MSEYTPPPPSEGAPNPKPAHREIGFALGVGVLLAPVIFFWFLLRPGYSTRQRTLGLIWLVLNLALTFAIEKNAFESGLGDISSPVATSTPTLGQPYQPLTLPPLTFTFEAASTRSSVGGEYAGEQASDGGVLVVVRYKIENTSTKPVSVGDVPEIKLIDPSGTTYAPDAGKTGAYALETHLDEKAWSDLNPGIRVQAAQVFEIAKASYDPSTWKVMIGDREALVSMRR